MTLLHFQHMSLRLPIHIGPTMEQHIGYTAIHLCSTLSSCIHVCKFQLAATAVFISQSLAKPQALSNVLQSLQT